MAKSRRRKKGENTFEVLPAGEMRRKYGLYAENAPKIALNPAKVPKPLHPLIPFAEKWGISDDLMREDLVQKASVEELDALRAALKGYDDALHEWLAGPEAAASNPSEEYIAFTSMRMAAD